MGVSTPIAGWFIYGKISMDGGWGPHGHGNHHRTITTRDLMGFNLSKISDILIIGGLGFGLFFFFD